MDRQSRSAAARFPATYPNPFCSVKRLTTPSNGTSGSISRPQSALQCFLVLRPLPAICPFAVCHGKIRVGCRIPLFRVDAVKYTGQAVTTCCQQTLHAETECFKLDFFRIVRADSDDVFGIEQPRLEKGHIAVIFHAVDAETSRWQMQLFQCRFRENALESQVMDAITLGTASGAQMQISWCQTGLPVVAMHKIGLPAKRCFGASQNSSYSSTASRNATRCPPSRGRRDLDKDRPSAERNSDNRALAAARHSPLRLTTDAMGKARNRSSRIATTSCWTSCDDDLGITRYEHTHVQTDCAQGGGQCTADVSQSARFDQRCNFGSCK